MRLLIFLMIGFLFLQCAKEESSLSTINVLTEFEPASLLHFFPDENLFQPHLELDMGDAEIVLHTIENIPEAYVFIEEQRPEIIMGTSLGVTEEFHWNGDHAVENFPQYTFAGEMAASFSVALVVRADSKVVQWTDLIQEDILIVTPHLYETYPGLLIYLALWVQARDLFEDDRKKIRTFIQQFSDMHSVFSISMTDAEYIFLHRGVGDGLLTFRKEATGIVEENPDLFVYVPLPQELVFPVYVQFRTDLIDEDNSVRLQNYIKYLLQDSEATDFEMSNRVTDFLGSWYSIVLTHIISGGEFSQIISDRSVLFFSSSGVLGDFEELGHTE